MGSTMTCNTYLEEYWKCKLYWYNHSYSKNWTTLIEDGKVSLNVITLYYVNSFVMCQIDANVLRGSHENIEKPNLPNLVFQCLLLMSISSFTRKILSYTDWPCTFCIMISLYSENRCVVVGTEQVSQNRELCNFIVLHFGIIYRKDEKKDRLVPQSIVHNPKWHMGFQLVTPW